MPPKDEIIPAIQEEFPKLNVVVIGLGMVGVYFIEKLISFDTRKRFRIETFSEEPVVAYNRVGLTQYFSHRSEERLYMQTPSWYEEQDVTVHLGDKAERIDRENKIVYSSKGLAVPYDYCVLATGSYAWKPPMPNVNSSGVFVYRTIEDLNKIIAYAANCKKSAVIGGGLLGLEAAKALHDLGLDLTIVEASPILMPRQLDKKGAKLLLSEIEKLGITHALGTPPKEVAIDENKTITGLVFPDGKILELDMLVVAAGIRPRDEIARNSDISVHQRGGIFVDDKLQTNDPNIFAIGEVALHGGMIYGLVAPGYEMAETVAANLASEKSDRKFNGGDLSSKLKLMGVHVASFGDYFAKDDVAMHLTYKDPFGSIYKKLLFSKDGKKLLGGILVGDTDEYAKLHALSKSKKPLTMEPGELILGLKSGQAPGADDLPDEAQICSCNNVSKGQIRDAIRTKNCRSTGEVKSCTKAGTGCGGCLPVVTEILTNELKSMGQKVTSSLCPHFEYTRVELFQIIKIKRLKTFKDIIETAGKKGSVGCEICKPAVASIIASLWNEPILNHATILDTNDRFLANIQRGGSYSVVPRVAGGEITPEKLIVLGQVAKRFGLYTKITGGQRVDLFGANKYDLPDIWEDLVNAGFESGHAYGKSLRTVKSCVGSTWCRYGIGDSVGFAIEIENRYKGIRSPHKIKAAVSGCVRECAEAQGKDFGLIATDKGFNIYVCGNGGAQPKHAAVLAKDVPEELCIKYLDRFLMYYIHTADKLTRTARWLEKMDGGINYLRSVVIDDKLGICKELEEDMSHLINTYHCEWTEVVKDPSRRAYFKQFLNTSETQPEIEHIIERGQRRPADWPKVFPEPYEKPKADHLNDKKSWVKIAPINSFPEGGGQVVKYGDTQIAIFNVGGTRWYATQNMCPHKRAFVLSSGMMGDDANGTVHVSCPMHKKNFALETGECISGDVDLKLMTFDIKTEDNYVWLELPPSQELDRLLGTSKWIVTRKHTKKEKESQSGMIEIVGSTEAVGCGDVACGDTKLDW
ncbi:7147_t:CDS:2 [Diversispora eburnea]|uniref:Nitrite reductase [NAD(P)H] n=1 Tax=Diversispora eburnea TaxID=1213867 RepID=A0A9N8YLR8_9GLOM|nr:7147_t:CDS:2 [Diversispora eburnea]